MQQCRIIFSSLNALHVSSDIFAHHQEHLNCIYSLWYYTRESLPAGFMGELGLTPVSWESWDWRQSVPTLPWNRPATTHVYNTRGCKYSLDVPDDERKYRSKHVEHSRNNKLSYTVASCWSFSYIISWCTEPWVLSLLECLIKPFVFIFYATNLLLNVLDLYCLVPAYFAFPLRRTPC